MSLLHSLLSAGITNKPHLSLPISLHCNDSGRYCCCTCVCVAVHTHANVRAQDTGHLAQLRWCKETTKLDHPWVERKVCWGSNRQGPLWTGGEGQREQDDGKQADLCDIQQGGDLG